MGIQRENRGKAAEKNFEELMAKTSKFDEIYESK